MDNHRVRPIGSDPTPSLIPEAIAYWDVLLQPYEGMCRVFEYGSGHSTIWLAKRAEMVVSVEHRQSWYAEVMKAAEMHGVSPQVILTSLAEYTAAIGRFPSEYFDFVSVDGDSSTRIACIGTAMGKVKVGGHLVIDDSNWRLLRAISKSLDEDLRWEGHVFAGTKINSASQLSPTQTSFYRRVAKCS